MSVLSFRSQFYNGEDGVDVVDDVDCDDVHFVGGESDGAKFVGDGSRPVRKNDESSTTSLFAHDDDAAVAMPRNDRKYRRLLRLQHQIRVDRPVN